MSPRARGQPERHHPSGDELLSRLRTKGSYGRRLWLLWLAAERDLIVEAVTRTYENRVSRRAGRLQRGRRPAASIAEAQLLPCRRASKRCSTRCEPSRPTYGVLPIENSIGGSIHRNYDLLLEPRAPDRRRGRAAGRASSAGAAGRDARRPRGASTRTRRGWRSASASCAR